MGKVITFESPGVIGFQEVEDRPLARKEVRLKTLFSGISAGTELTAYRGVNPYLHKQWEEKRRLFLPVDTPTMQFPVVGWGYEECGEVIELGSEVSMVKVGDRIYGTWGHRTNHIVTEEYAAGRILPTGLDPILGVFSQIGAIALNGVHDGRIRIGETVAVFGLGTPGQIVAQLAKKSGARVVGVDLNPLRLKLAKELGGVDVALNAGEGNVAEQIKDLTANRGADVAIEASGFYGALAEAVRATAYSARVVAMGFFQGGGDLLRLGEEFHHNRINIVCSQIYGVDPELTYRWNQERLVRTVMELQADGTLNLMPLITHRFSFEDAAEAFRLCDQEPEKTVQVVLEF